MGKILRITGANFSSVAVGRVNPDGDEKYEIAVQNGIVNIADATYLGDLDVDQNGNANIPNSRMRSSSPIYIPAGASIRLDGLKGIDATHVALILSAIWYSSPTTNHETLVGMSCTPGSASTYFDINKGGNESAIITNSGAVGYWYMFTIRRIDSQSSAVSPSNYSPLIATFVEPSN